MEKMWEYNYNSIDFFWEKLEGYNYNCNSLEKTMEKICWWYKSTDMVVQAPFCHPTTKVIETAPMDVSIWVSSHRVSLRIRPVTWVEKCCIPWYTLNLPISWGKNVFWFQTSRNLVCFIMSSIIFRQSDIVPIALTW